MTVDSNQIIKISVVVDGEIAGGMIANSSNHSLYSHLIDAINSGDDIHVLQVSSGHNIYKNGTPFDKKANVFNATEEDILRVNNYASLQAFSLVGNRSVLYTEILDPQTQAGLVAAYQSSPTFTVQELENE